MLHTLKNMALAASAVNFWNSPEIKVDMENYFFKKSNLYSHEPCQNEWKDIENKILEMLRSLRLPEKLHDELKDVVKIIGRKIFYWTKYVCVDLNLNIKYAEEIYWTAGGSIDEAKIFKDSWLPDPNFNASKRKRVSQIALPSFRFGCLFMQREFIVNKNPTDMGKVIQSFSGKMNKLEKYKLIESQVQNDLKTRNVKSLHRTVKLFFLSLYSGLDKVVKYLGETIGPNLQHFLNQAIKVCLEEWKCEANDHVKDKFMEIFVFLSSKMPAETKHKFIATEINSILDLLLDVWSYHEQYLDILNLALNELPSKLCSRVLINFINHQYLIKNINSLSNVQKEIVSKILELIMSKVPRGTKIAFFVRKSILGKIFEGLNFSVLNLIINDKDLVDQREYLIGIGTDLCRECVKEGKFEIFDKFVEEVLRPDDQKMILTNKINFLFDLITTEKFELAEKFLDGIGIPEDKKLRTRGRIELISICSSLIPENSDPELIKKLLEFESVDEEITKNLTKVYDVILTGLCKIWATTFRNNKEQAVRACSEFLKLFLKPQKVDYFKRTKIVRNENFIKLFCSQIIPEHFEIIHDFFKLCGVPVEKINRIKSKIIYNLEEWVYFYAFQQDNFLMVHHIVSWIFEDAFEKRQAVEDFLVSDAGALLCIKIISEEKYNERKEEILTLLNAWIKPCKGNVIDLLLIKISEADCDEILKNYIITTITSLDDTKMPERMTIEENNLIMEIDDDPDFEMQKTILADIKQIKFENEISFYQEANHNTESMDDDDFDFVGFY